MMLPYYKYLIYVYVLISIGPKALDKKVFFGIFLLTFSDQFANTVIYPFLPAMLATYFPEADDGKHEIFIHLIILLYDLTYTYI